MGLEHSRGGARRKGLPAVIVHLTFDEPIITQTTRRDVTPPYSGLEPFTVACYSMLEIVAAKLPALLQQQEKWPRPRDLYDLWCILCQQREPIGAQQLRELFEGKCAGRGVAPDRRRLASAELREWNRRAWGAQLLPTLRDGPDYDRGWAERTTACATLLP